MAKRVHWTPPADLVKLVHAAAAEQDAQKHVQMNIEYQKAMVDQANLFILFQPIYQFAVRDTVKHLPADRGRMAGGPLRREGMRP